MRFDAARALETFHELGDPRFAGPDGEEQVAHFVAERFTRMGLNVERRTVVGSRFSRRVGPWVGWLGYGALLVASFVLVRRKTLLSSLLAFALSWLIMRWLIVVVRNRLHLGRRRPPLEEAPVVSASLPSDSAAPVRVVFQALLGGLEPDLLTHFLPRGRFAVVVLLLIGPVLTNFCIIIDQIKLILFPNRGRPLVVSSMLTQYAYPGLVFVWIGVLSLLGWEYFRQRRMGGSYGPERRGLAILIELARTWPRTGARPIAPIFVTAGGQRLDYAGAREVVRLLESEWSSRRSLLILLIAPGAGDQLCLCTHDFAQNLHELARDAARSLWIPIQSRTDFLALLPLWPFENCHPAIALMGSNHRAFSDDSVDAKVLQSAAQLATEIALRWGKQQQPPSAPPDSAT